MKLFLMLLSLVGIHRLTFTTRTLEEGNMYSFYFTSEPHTHWKAGQHFVFWIPNVGWHVVREQLRAFSVSSAPSEGHVRITTRYLADKGSVYKQRLFALSPNAHIWAIGPLMWFYIKPHALYHVGIAGGIGITPMRSILRELDTARSTLPFTLIYQNMPGPVAFKDELDAIATRNANIHIRYLTNPEVTDKQVIVASSPDIAKTQFYLSGSPGFIKAMEHILLEELGVHKQQIVQDGFWDFRERFVNVWNALVRSK